MNDYIIIQHTNAKTRLKSSFSETGINQLKFGNGRILEYNPVHESEMCTLVYTPLMETHMVVWLNKLFDDLKPYEIDDFFERFKQDHPLTSVQNTPRKERIIASKNRYCELISPLFADSIKLTEEQETMLVDMVTSGAIDRRYVHMTGCDCSIGDALRHYFAWYCQQYGFSARYKKDICNQANDLAWHFCNVHGFDWEYVNKMSLVRSVESNNEPLTMPVIDVPESSLLSDIKDDILHGSYGWAIVFWIIFFTVLALFGLQFLIVHS